MTNNRIGTVKKTNIFFSDTKNYLKLMGIFLLGLLFVISIIVLILAYRSQKRAIVQNVVISDPEAIKTASDTIMSLLPENTLHIVKDYGDKENFLEVKVDSTPWNKLSIRDRKKFIKDLSAARSTLGLKSDVKVIDSKSGVELATSERGRIVLAGHDD